MSDLGAISSATGPFYLIVKGSMVPKDSSEFEEIERIKREADFSEVNQLTVMLPKEREIRVCGASRWISVHTQYMELRKHGFNVTVHEAGCHVLDYDGA